jgi:hypothetical protein
LFPTTATTNNNNDNYFLFESTETTEKKKRKGIPALRQISALRQRKCVLPTLSFGCGFSTCPLVASRTLVGGALAGKPSAEKNQKVRKENQKKKKERKNFKLWCEHCPQRT